jgi:hypothetical protein
MGLGERVRYQTSYTDSARWDGFVFRPGDIVISTPAKCGTTWLQMICALEIFRSATFDRPLDQISPWLDVLLRPLTGVLADLEAQAHRRFIKTHTPLDGLPFDDRVTYLCASRDPRDVAVSLDSHASNTDRAVSLALREDAVGAVVLDELLAAAPSLPSGTARERFWSWVNPAAPGKTVSDLEIMLHHLDTFWQVRDQPNIVLLRYEDLLDDLEGQMRYIAARLGIAITETAWPASSRPKPATTASITTAASSSTADQQASGGRSSARRSFPGTLPESPNARPQTLPPGSISPRCRRQATSKGAVHE